MKRLESITLILKEMATYRISGVWISGGVITHYAIHEVTDSQGGYVAQASKTTKADAIKLVEKTGNTVTTMVWNYSTSAWHVGETVQVVGTGSDKYLRSDPDRSLTDNLGHLPNFAFLY